MIDLQRGGQVAEEQLVERAGMTFHRIPMTTHTPPTAQQIAEFLALVTDPANQPVYVHCAGGRHRTGVMTAVYRMAREGWTSDRAFKEMKQSRFGADFLHSEFKKFVYAYRAEPKGEAPAGVIATTTVNSLVSSATAAAAATAAGSATAGTATSGTTAAGSATAGTPAAGAAPASTAAACTTTGVTAASAGSAHTTAGDDLLGGVVVGVSDFLANLIEEQHANGRGDAGEDCVLDEVLPVRATNQNADEGCQSMSV